MHATRAHIEYSTNENLRNADQYMPCMRQGCNATGNYARGLKYAACTPKVRQQEKNTHTAYDINSRNSHAVVG